MVFEDVQRDVDRKLRSGLDQVIGQNVNARTVRNQGLSAVK